MKFLESLALTQESIENCYRFLRKEKYNETGPRKSYRGDFRQRERSWGKNLTFGKPSWCLGTPDLVMNMSSGFQGRWMIRK